ncbi:apolipoprotein C-IV isoform X2 [Cheilinus undulatus]|nr:apolipoprotein C-IV isoform X2 [Cheilinus undulatus]
MHLKELSFTLILLMQACGPLSAQTPATTTEPDAPGILERLADRVRAAKAKVQGYGDLAMGFAGTYYEDHIQPMTDRYIGWASNMKNSMLEKVQSTFDHYNPLKASAADE